jgi:hypothetical protein
MAATTRAIETILPGKASLWDLFELDPDNGGDGWKSDLGKVLALLDSKTLYKTWEWVDDNRDEAMSRYGAHNRSEVVRLLVGFFAHFKALPPEPLFADTQDGFPLQAVAIRNDGRKWDLTLPIRAALLQRARRYLSERNKAELTGMKRSSYKRMEARMKQLGLKPPKFKADDLEAIILPKKTGPKPKSEE